MSFIVVPGLAPEAWHAPPARRKTSRLLSLVFVLLACGPVTSLAADGNAGGVVNARVEVADGCDSRQMHLRLRGDGSGELVETLMRAPRNDAARAVQLAKEAQHGSSPQPLEREKASPFLPADVAAPAGTQSIVARERIVSRRASGFRTTFAFADLRELRLDLAHGVMTFRLDLSATGRSTLHGHLASHAEPASVHELACGSTVVTAELPGVVVAGAPTRQGGTLLLEWGALAPTELVDVAVEME